MNKLKDKCIVACVSKIRTVFNFILTMFLLVWLVGCGDQVRLPSAQQLIEFDNAGPGRPSLDIDRLVRADVSGDPYRVVPGDVLELTMPAIVRFVTAKEADGGIDAATPYPCRVNERGNITLPIVGDISVAGKTLSQVESEVVDTYCPEYVVTRPSVFARVLEYKTAKVSITGAVQKPGIYSLRSDQMSLVALLMEAGGIVDEGAAVIRIVRRNLAVPYREDGIPDTSEEALEHSTEVNSATRLRATASHSSDSGIDIELSFRESATLSTTGKLTIRHGQTLLFAEHMDITDPGERLLLLSKLERSEPRISVNEMDEKLCMLAALLENSAGKHGPGEKNSSENINSRAEYSGNPSVRSTPSKTLQRRKSPFSTADAKQSLWSPVGPAQYHHAMLNRQSIDLDKDANSSGAASASDLASDMSEDEVFDKKAVEIITQNRSPRSERITESGRTQRSEALVLPVKGVNIPFANVVLHDGDSVIVERLQLPLFSVVGLVKSPGNFPYPPDVRYNLMQALAFAGGLDRATEPRYATIYRLKPDGTIVSAVFEVVHVGNGSRLTEALNTVIKPGDIIAVEHTPRTRTKQFLDTVFRINVGTYWQLNDARKD
ncbi:MAG: SLBB domain-containing protein [Sedimentisphaerales bacterium]